MFIIITTLVALTLLLITALAQYYPLKSPQDFCIATVAVECSDDINTNIQKMISIINDLTISKKPDLILFGEMVLSHYVIEESQLEKLSFSIKDDKIKLFQELAKENNTMLSFGFLELDNEKYYNSQILIDSSGEILGVHRKKNLTRFEKRLFHKGKKCISVFRKNDIKIGISICYDIFHAEFKKSFSQKNPQIILHSLADPLDPLFPTGYNGRKTNSVYISANRFGNEGRIDYTGHIAAVSASGKILELKYGSESQITKCFLIETSPNALRDFINTISNTVLKGIHLIRHYKHVINFVKWDRKVKKQS